MRRAGSIDQGEVRKTQREAALPPVQDEVKSWANGWSKGLVRPLVVGSCQVQRFGLALLGLGWMEEMVGRVQMYGEEEENSLSTFVKESCLDVSWLHWPVCHGAGLPPLAPRHYHLSLCSYVIREISWPCIVNTAPALDSVCSLARIARGALRGRLWSTRARCSRRHPTLRGAGHSRSRHTGGKWILTARFSRCF